MHTQITPHAGHSASITKINRRMVNGEITAVNCKNHLKYIQTVLMPTSHLPLNTNSKQTEHEADRSLYIYCLFHSPISQYKNNSFIFQTRTMVSHTDGEATVIVRYLHHSPRDGNICNCTSSAIYRNISVHHCLHRNGTLRVVFTAECSKEVALFLYYLVYINIQVVLLNNTNNVCGVQKETEFHTAVLDRRGAVTV